jgi:hypothetical protein
MEDESQVQQGTSASPGGEVRSLIRDTIQEFMQAQRSKTEPAYKAELVEERRRREELERRVNELAEENRRSRQVAEEAERATTIRAELQRLGVGKVDLAFKAVRDEIVRTEDGNLVARTGGTELPLQEYLSQFVNENPELLPARMTGGSGATTGQKSPAKSSSSIDLDRIKPGMNREELDKVRQEVARIALQSMDGR